VCMGCGLVIVGCVASRLACPCPLRLAPKQTCLLAWRSGVTAKYVDPQPQMWEAAEAVDSGDQRPTNGR
jgi:hypothetical protein